MRFRLIYDGVLKATQGSPAGQQRAGRARDKNTIRRQFHPQLRTQWQTHPVLSEHRVFPGDYANIPPGVAVWQASPHEMIPLIDAVSHSHIIDGRRFVPLVRKDWKLACEVSVLLMRPTRPGGLWGSQGDLDNRIKTLVDGLRMPKPNEMDGLDEPTPADDPFYCLLEDDDDISAVSVETDRLLLPHDTRTDEDRLRVHAVITVNVLARVVTTFNLGLT